MNRPVFRAARLTVLTAALALGAASLLLATPASAHDALVDSTPRAGETVHELPASFSITMNEPLATELGTQAFAMQVTDAEGRFYGDGCLAVAGATMSMGATLGEPGAYRMVWQITSSDGHPTSGEVAFTWEPAPDAPRTAGRDAAPVCGEAVEPTPTAEPEPEPTATATDAPAHHDDAAGGEVLPMWAVIVIGAAVLAAAIVTTVLLVRRSRRSEE